MYVLQMLNKICNIRYNELVIVTFDKNKYITEQVALKNLYVKNNYIYM